MSIHTVGSVVLLGVGTPYSFELVEVEILISGLEVDDLNLDFGLAVGKGTEFLVLALGSFVVVDLAEFTFVSGGMINLLNFVMGVGAIFEWAVFLLAKFVAVIFKIRPPLVNIVVVENAGFPFVMI